MENNNMGAAEAILFASGEPVETAKIAEVLRLPQENAYKLLKMIQDKYRQENSGVILVELSRSFQMCSNPAFAEEVRAALELKRNTPLSGAALEVLAIVAYNQPVTRAFIEQIRGVDSSQTLMGLVEKGLVEEAGRLNVPGKPISYQTTEGFLRNFSMKSLEELPPLPKEMEDRDRENPSESSEHN